MMERRIERWFDGTLRPTFPDSPRLSSARVPWNAFLVEGDPCVEGRADSIAWPHAEIIMVTSGGIWVENRAFGHSKGFFAPSGSITIWPAEHESRATAWKPLDSRGVSAGMISVQLEGSALRRLAPDLDHHPVAMQSAVQDAELASLLHLIEYDIRGGCATGRLYGEALCLALTTRVLARYGIAGPEQRSCKPGLSVRQRERVRDHVRTHLGRDLGLAELAGVAALSPQHFAATFRNSFGLSPHQYVILQRIDEARRLLANPTLPIAEVALAVGFATQSHFTVTFKRVVGVTPRRYRETL